MFAKERQDDIVQQVNINGSVRVKDLSIKYNVTEDCIRKDLAILEKNGLLKKAYGGAVSIRQNPHMYNSEERKSTPNHERVAIAMKAIQLLNEQDTIFLDISLTSVEIAKQLTQTSIHITVITNMLEVLNIISHSSHISVIFTGGQLNSERDGFWGSLSINMLKFFKIDKSFLGVVGVNTLTGELSTYYVDDGFMKKAIIEQSQISYLLCEERKFKEDGNFVFASLNDVSGLVTCKELNHKQLEQLEKYNVVLV